jgi:DNA gyrase/topoisomerase IV subunit A
MSSIVVTNLVNDRQFRIEYDDVWVWRVGPEGNRYEECLARAAYTLDGERIAFADMGVDDRGHSASRMEYDALETFVVTVSRDGRALRCYATDFRRSERSSMGVSGMFGAIAHSFTAKIEDDVVVVTNRGTMARFRVASIRVGPRVAFGVILMHLGPGEYVANVSPIPAFEEAEPAYGSDPLANVS